MNLIVKLGAVVVVGAISIILSFSLLQVLIDLLQTFQNLSSTLEQIN